MLMLYWDQGGKYAVLVRNVHGEMNVKPMRYTGSRKTKNRIHATIVELSPSALVTAAITNELGVKSMRSKYIKRVVGEFGFLPPPPRRRYNVAPAVFGYGTKTLTYARWEQKLKHLVDNAREHVRELNTKEKHDEAQGLRQEAGTGAS